MTDNTQELDEILCTFMNEIEWSVNSEMLSRATIDREKEASALEVAKALLEKRELEARLDELQQATDKRYTGINHLRNVGYLRNRIAELKAQQEQL